MRVGVMSRYNITTNLKDDSKKGSGIIFSPYIMNTVTHTNNRHYPRLLVSDDGEFVTYDKDEIDLYNNQKNLEKLEKLSF